MSEAFFSDWVRSLNALVVLAQQQQSRRHVRVRTFEATQEAFVDTQDELWRLRPSWASSVLDGSFKQRATEQVRFLLLVRGRIAPRVPAEVWSMIVLRAVGCSCASSGCELLRFGHLQGELRLRLHPLAGGKYRLPTANQLAVLWQPGVLMAEDRARLCVLVCDAGLEMGDGPWSAPPGSSSGGGSSGSTSAEGSTAQVSAAEVSCPVPLAPLLPTPPPASAVEISVDGGGAIALRLSALRFTAARA